MRILVVEDEDALREDLLHKLTDTGFSVDVAYAAAGVAQRCRMSRISSILTGLLK